MNSFTYSYPVKVYFGEKAAAKNLAAELANIGPNVMLAYGGGSIKKNGIYDELLGILKDAGKTVTEFAGIMSNPTYAKVQEGAVLAKEKNIDFILAVGGGSVIDCCKIISAQAKLDKDIWELEYTDHKQPTEFIPMGAVVTAFGTGAEMNNGAVITNEEKMLKSALWGAFCSFAILDPAYTMTMPMKQVISGAFDSLSHSMETYMGSPREVNLSDEINEATQRNIIRNIRATLKDLQDIQARSELIWAAAMADKTSSDHPGTVTRLDYDSKDYVGDGAAITKTAYVYTPYGYDENDEENRYNIVYLMHGWGGHAGEYFEYSSTKNMFDHLIENGEIPPVIIVSATFYNENSDTGFSGSIAEFRQFHRDFEENLMPAVEGRFHTYAQSASDEDLKDSRDHRAFGGFSLGSVTTWLQFCYDTDYIRYFLPMSGSCWYYGTYGDFQIERNVDFIEQLVKDNNLERKGYFIYHAVGTQDAVKSQSIDMAEEMLDRSDVFTPEHYVFYQKKGGYHNFDAVQEYLYNALPLFFGSEES